MPFYGLWTKKLWTVVCRLWTNTYLIRPRLEAGALPAGGPPLPCRMRPGGTLRAGGRTLSCRIISEERFRVGRPAFRWRTIPGSRSTIYALRGTKITEPFRWVCGKRMRPETSMAWPCCRLRRMPSRVTRSPLGRSVRPLGKTTGSLRGSSCPLRRCIICPPLSQ